MSTAPDTEARSGPEPLPEELVRSRRPLHRRRRRRRHWRSGLFLFIVAGYLLTASGRIQTIDISQTIMVAAGIRSGHGFTISMPVSAFGGAVANSKGQVFARHDLGMSLLFLPLTFLPATVRQGLPTARLNFLASFLNPVTGALAALVFADLLRLLGLRRRTVIVTTLLFAFGTIAWPYAHVAFDAVPATLCLLLAFWGFERYRVSSQLRWLVVGGAGLGFATVIRADTIFLIAFVSIPALVEAWQHRSNLRRAVAILAAWSIPVATGMAIDGWYNWVRFGSPVNDGVLKDPSTQMTTPLLHGVRGLLLSPGKGLVVFSPLVVVALLGWPMFLRRRVLAVSVATTFVAATVSHAPLVAWSGDLAWGPRYLVPVAALLTIPLAFLLDRMLADIRRYRAGLAAVGVVAIAAVCVQVSGVAVDYYAVAVNHPDVAVERNYFAVAHSQIRYHFEAIADSVRGREPYPSTTAGGVTPAPVPRFDFWWLDNLTRRQRRARTLVIVGLIVGALVAGGALAAGGLGHDADDAAVDGDAGDGDDAGGDDGVGVGDADADEGGVTGPVAPPPNRRRSLRPAG